MTPAIREVTDLMSSLDERDQVIIVDLIKSFMPGKKTLDFLKRVENGEEETVRFSSWEDAKAWLNA